jgi:hypothetical protein
LGQPFSPARKRVSIQTNRGTCQNTARPLIPLLIGAQPLQRYILHAGSPFFGWAPSLFARFRGKLYTLTASVSPTAIRVPATPSLSCRSFTNSSQRRCLPHGFVPLDSHSMIAVPPSRSPQQAEISSIHHAPSEALKIEVTGSWDPGLRNRIMTTHSAKSIRRSAGAVLSRQPPRRVVSGLWRRDETARKRENTVFPSTVSEQPA